MASSFPGAIDNFTDPLANSSLASPSHAGQHSDLNDAVEKIETYMGLVKVIPTSGTNCTISSTGTITISSQASATINGCFSSLYDNYRIVLSGITASTAVDVNIRLGTTSTGYYGSRYYDLYTGAGTGTARSNNAAQFTIGNATSANDEGISTVDITNPFATKRTSWVGNWYGNGYGGWLAGTLADTSSYANLQVLTNTGTMTASLRVYGYRN